MVTTRKVQQQRQPQPLQHHQGRIFLIKGPSNQDMMMCSSNMLGLRGIRLLLNVVASAALILVLFMAQRLEAPYARLRDNQSILEVGD
jgi:hypothetical protein